MEPMRYIWKRTGVSHLDANVYWGKKGRPALLFFHGGALIMCHKDIVVSGYLKRYGELGYTTISINYRLAPASSMQEIQSDVQDAIVWSRLLLDENGYSYSPLVATGHSAGGYLALLSGILPVRPNAIVSVYGYANLLSDWCHSPSEHYANMDCMSSEIATLNSDDYSVARQPEDPLCNLYFVLRAKGRWVDFCIPAFALAQQKQAYLRSISPFYNADKSYPPTLLIHGTSDYDVPAQESVCFYESLCKLGVASRLLLVEGVGHSFDFDESSEQSRSALNAIVQFVEETF